MIEHWKNLSLENIVGEMEIGVVVEETWKDVPGYEQQYIASTFGRVRSLKREITLKLIMGSRGYLQCGLSFEQWAIHRLIGTMFIPNPENKPEINHKNGIKWDNRICNIEWATRSENQKHAFAMGLQKTPTETPIVQLNKDGSFVKSHSGIHSAARSADNLYIGNIHQVINNIRKTHAGYRWMYKEDYEKMIGIAV